MYSELQPDRIIETLIRLEQRIEDSFPGSGLGRVTAEMTRLAREAGPTAGWLRRPLWPLRLGTALGILGVLAALLGFAGLAMGASLRVEGVAELLQASEAAANEIILLSLAIFFLWSLEARAKRNRALAALHRLRSIVHIVDMHQLTKDPQHLLSPGNAKLYFRLAAIERRRGDRSAAIAALTHGTDGAPKRTYSRFELARYLDFCSELLSLASKLAALHVQYLNDPVVLGAVNDIEALAGSLSSKIWQKIMILDVMVPGGRRAVRSSGREHRRLRGAGRLRRRGRPAADLAPDGAGLRTFAARND